MSAGSAATRLPRWIVSTRWRTGSSRFSAWRAAGRGLSAITGAAGPSASPRPRAAAAAPGADPGPGMPAAARGRADLLAPAGPAAASFAAVFFAAAEPAAARCAAAERVAAAVFFAGAGPVVVRAAARPVPGAGWKRPTDGLTGAPASPPARARPGPGRGRDGATGDPPRLARRPRSRSPDCHGRTTASTVKPPTSSNTPNKVVT
ncbi:hypothetical protein CS0771_18920 [Catellatospora sp. IY07-71]|nr:hypothetical protein CS0771_18920 [Catellatospora sp. IY07-71]